MKIIELLYKEDRIFFYATDENSAFIFGTSNAKAPKLITEETNCYAWHKNKEIVFQALTYEIEAQMKADKSLVTLYTFENVKEEDRTDFFHKLVKIATE